MVKDIILCPHVYVQKYIVHTFEVMTLYLLVI